MRNTIVTILIILTLTVVNSAAAQPSETRFGPVVNAYLARLSEDLSELEYQIRQREISPQEYGRARARLLLLRDQVELQASGRSEDRVPELQILRADELARLKLRTIPDHALLQVGSLLDEQWRLLSIAGPTREAADRFFIFARVTPQKTSGNEDERLLLPSRKITVPPEKLIETVVVPENDYWLRLSAGDKSGEPPKPQVTNNVPGAVSPPPAQKSSPAASAPAQPVPAAKPPVAEPKVTTATVSRTNTAANTNVAAGVTGTRARETTPAATAAEPPEGLRIIRLHVPDYTVEARGERIEGELILSVMFRHDGWIREIEVLKGLGHGLDERAVAAVKRTFYEPPMQNGRPVDVRAQVVYRFTLDGVTGNVTKLAPAKGSQP